MENKIRLLFGEDVLTLPRAAAGEALMSASPTALRVLLLLASDGALRADFAANAERVSTALSCTAEELEEALSFWQSAGVLLCEGFVPRQGGEAKPSVPSERSGSASPTLAAAAAERVPNYNGIELDRIVNGNPGIVHVMNECQRILDYMFKTAELNDIMAMSDYLGLDNDYILLAVQYAHERGIKRVSGVKTCVLRWVRNGITTHPALEAYISLCRERQSFESRLRSLFGMGERKLTAREEQIFAEWSDAKVPEELIKRAYDITVDKVGKPQMSYTAKIISNWREQGVTSLSELDNKPKPKPAAGSFDTDEFFELALKRSYERLGVRPPDGAKGGNDKK